MLDTVKETFQCLEILGTTDFEDRVHKNGCDVVVTGNKTADKTVEFIEVVNAVLVGAEKTCVIIDVITEMIRFFNNNNVSVLVLNSVSDFFNQLLCFAGALGSHYDFNQVNHSFGFIIAFFFFLCKRWGRNYFSFLRRRSPSRSYPGFPSSANILLLYICTPGWLNGLTPNI